MVSERASRRPKTDIAGWRDLDFALEVLTADRERYRREVGG